MTAGQVDRAAAYANIRGAGSELDALRNQRVPTDVSISSSQRAHAFAAIATAQALLRIGDILTAALTPPKPTTTPVNLIEVTSPADAAPRYVLGKGAAEALVAMGWTPPGQDDGR